MVTSRGSALPQTSSDSNRLRRRFRRAASARYANLLTVLAPTLLFTLAQVTHVSRITIHHTEPEHFVSQTRHQSNKYAVVNFVDKDSRALWGIYSIHKQMIKFGMLPGIRHVALAASDIKKSDMELVTEWLGEDNVQVVDKHNIRDQVPKGVWTQVFSKLEFFNLTKFDKVIGLDNDIYIRRNLNHWFDYPAPAATQTRGTMEFNSGAMVIAPSADLYNKLIEYIPKTRRFKASLGNGTDTWNSGQGHQGFLSAFFSSNVTDDTMFTMNYGSSVLTSDLMEQKANAYYWRYRPHTIETVHLTHKPWKLEAAPTKADACDMYREWLATVADAPRDRLPPLKNFLRKCPVVDREVIGLELLPTTSEQEESVEENEE